MPKFNTTIIWTPMSGMWVCVGLRTGTKKSMHLKENEHHVQNLLTILDSIVIMIGVTYMVA